MWKRPTLEDYIDSLDRSYDQNGIRALHHQSYTELGLLVMRRQHQLERAIKKIRSSTVPEPADIRWAVELDRQRVEIYGVFRTRVRESTGEEVPEAKRTWPSIVELELDTPEMELE